MIIRKPFELVSAITLILWGFWVSLPVSTFSVGVVYHEMAKIAPEPVWGCTILVVGILKIILMYSKYIRLRIILAILIMGIFSTLSILFLLGSWASVGVPMYISFAIVAWFAYLEILFEKKFPPLKLG